MRINTWRKQLKNLPFGRTLGRWLRRNVLRSKYIYFLSTSPKPISDWYGFDRGTPLDRYYIESFLCEHASCVTGKCLELLNNNYTIKYSDSHVTRSDVLDIDQTNQNASIIGDLRSLQGVENNTYDCIILTQVLQFIDDVDAAISETFRVLKPGGVLLATLPTISRADCTSGVTGDFWRFTPASALYLFEKKFSQTDIEITAYGNARTSMFFYIGLALEDTPKKILDIVDESFPTLVGIKATKPLS